MEKTIMVGMAEIKITRCEDEVLAALGLGSCIGICAYDSLRGIAGMAHVVLPSALETDAPLSGKYADTAVPLLLQAMQQAGARKDRLNIAIVGGAQVFAFSGGQSRMEIGSRNAAAVLRALQGQGLPVMAQDTGGVTGRTVHLYTRNGRVRVKTLGQGERDLVYLGNTLLGQPAKAA